MSRDNYSYKKRQKELARKKKAEEKRQRKLERKAMEARATSPEAGLESGQAPDDQHPAL